MFKGNVSGVVLPFFLLFGFVAFNQVSQAADYSVTGTCKKSSGLDKVARDFMADNGMIKEGEEQYWSSIKAGIRWQLVKTIPIKNKGCALVMRLTDFPKPLDRGPLEVLGLVAKKIVSFENMMGLNPESDKVQIEVTDKADGAPRKYPGYSLFAYGNEAIAARKIFLVQNKELGNFFMGWARRLGQNEKLPLFESKTDRNWVIEQGKIDLRSDACDEAAAIYPHDLDRDFEATRIGAGKKDDNGMEVCPWGPYLLKLNEAGN